MLIRKFKSNDAKALFNVFYSAVHDIAINDYTDEQLNAWAPANYDLNVWANKLKILQPFVIENDNKIVGYADIQVNGLIDHFFIARTYSRQGFGSKLMEYILEEARLLNINIITANVSKTAQPFFAKFGFTVTERRYPIVRNVLLENALMIKHLDFIHPNAETQQAMQELESGNSASFNSIEELINDLHDK